MAKLYDLLLKDNSKLLDNERNKHGLNIFFSRILFCFFSEDTDIFEQGSFTKSIISHTKEDGSDLDSYLTKFFQILNKKERKDVQEYFKIFPYVNGGLFKNEYKIPIFSKEARKILIESGSLDWSSINPDILGSMMQALVSQGIRQEIGMHYTSVSNILKVIKPLFIDNLYNKIIENSSNEKKLKSILKEIYDILIFDPACGSGNFLVISYKELYRLEIEVLKKLRELDNTNWLITSPGISLKQFFGIELDDYAHETAKVSMWIAQHQMNSLFKEIFDEIRPTLPLKVSVNIKCGNALKLNWDKVCPKNNGKQIYIIGNPPYLGSSMQNKNQKEDLKNIFEKTKSYKNLDYICCWFKKASEYISNTNYEVSFVSTNSITQGEQVQSLWPFIFKDNIEIGFAYRSFKWINYAKHKAGVTCVIINLRKLSNKKKFIIENNNINFVKNINPYLIDINPHVIVKRTPIPINGFPEMFMGNKPTDGGHFVLNEKEKNELVSKHKESKEFIKKYIGSFDFFNGSHRWCLWISDEKKNKALKINFIKERIKKVESFRKRSRAPSTNQAASYSHRFRQIQHQPDKALMVPRVSSENRVYVPCGFIDEDYVVGDSSNVIYKPPLFIFGVLSSKMHMVWFKTVAGRLENSLRYSTNFCYNAFPFPKIDNQQKKILEEISMEILDEREKFSELNLSQLYNPLKMPESLLKKHLKLDDRIDNMYEKKVFVDETERIKYLFELYEKNIYQGNLI